MTMIDRKWKVYEIILIIEALYSLKAWFFWWIPDMMAVLVIFMINALFMLSTPFWDYNNSRKKVAAILILVLFIYRTFVDGGVFNYYVVQILSSFSLIPLILLKPKYQISLLESFQRVIVIILAVGLVFWILHFFGIGISPVQLTYGEIDRGRGLEDQYLFDNYYIFLVNQSWMLNPVEIVPDFLRFSSVFLEPGYVAILMVFLLSVNNFNFKDWRNYVYIATIIASVSLAGFLIGAFALFAIRMRGKKHMLLWLVSMLVLVFIGYTFFKNYNNGNNFINQGIIERMEYDESEGTIAGYNRTSEDVDKQFSNFLFSSDILFGVGHKTVAEMSGSSVGYKVYIMQYGLLGLVLFLLFLLILCKSGGNFQSRLLLLIYLLMFIRGHNTMLWLGFVLVYVCGIALSKYDIHNDEKNSTDSALQRV